MDEPLHTEGIVQSFLLEPGNRPNLLRAHLIRYAAPQNRRRIFTKITAARAIDPFEEKMDLDIDERHATFYGHRCFTKHSAKPESAKAIDRHRRVY